MELTLQVSDKARLHTKTFLAPHHIEIVQLLYQPIIGITACNLYLTLWSLVNLEKRDLTMFHGQLLTFFGWDLNTFLENRYKLEAIDLLNTYYSPAEGYYLYELRQPLSSKQFFQDSNLNVHLLYQVGYNLYEYLEKKFVVNQPRGFTNISKSFEAVYPQLSQVKTIDEEREYFQHTSSHISIPVTYQFDYELFSSLLHKSFISSNIFDPDVKNQIIREATLYNFDAQMMSKIVLDCVGKDGEVDFSVLHQTASRYYKKLRTKSNERKVQPTITNLEIKMNQELDDPRMKALINYKTKTPHEWLRILQKNTEVPNSYLEVVKLLMDEFNFNYEVINVLVEFVLNRTDRLPVEYVRTIAASWAWKKVQTAEDAMALVDQTIEAEAQYAAEGKPIPTFYGKRNKVYRTKEPTWFESHEEYRKNAKDEIENVDLAELEKLLASLK